MKVTFESNLGGAPEDILRALNAAKADFAHHAVEEVATDVRADISQRQRDWLFEGEKGLLEQKAPKKLLESIRAYLIKLNVTVTHTSTASGLSVEVDGRQMSEIGYQYETLARLLEYGGQVVVGGKTYLIPPYPHWRSMVVAAQKSVEIRGPAWLQRFITEVQRRLSGAIPLRRE